jgi:uncharacterized protein (TIGR02231 family)
MKHLLLIPAFFSLFTGVLKAQPKSVSSSINEVTVYLQGARVSRTAHISLVPGNNDIVFDDLSNNIVQGSIEIEGGVKATIMSVNFQTDQENMSPKTEGLKRLVRTCDSLEQKLEMIQNQHYTLDEELQLLKDNHKTLNPEAGGFADQLEETADFYRKRVLEVKNKLSEVIRQENALSQKLTDARTQLKTKFNNTAGQVLVTFSSKDYETADVTFSYFVNAASWHPEYNLRAQNITDPVLLEYDAAVNQQTCEDWKDVKLTLSTGNPSIQTVNPELSAWFINFYQPVRIYNKSESIGYDDKDKKDLYPMAARSGFSTAADFTKVSQNATNTSFEINLKYDIPSDINSRHVRIQQYNLPVQFSYKAIPKLDPDAYLLGKITGWGEYNLLPGEANIYLEGAYVCKSVIDPSSTSDTLNVSFGRDKRITLKRTRIKDFSKKQFLGSHKTETFGFVLSVKNLKNAPVSILIEDQIPVSQDKDIEVELTEPAGAKLDAATGKLSWELNLNPNEDKTMQFEYTVKSPKDKIVGY